MGLLKIAPGAAMTADRWDMSIPTAATTTTSTTDTSALTSATTGTSGHHGRRAMFDAAAKALGMSEQDLHAALRDGQSLDDLAAAKGVSHDTLISAMKSAAPQRLADSPDAATRLDAIAAHKRTEGTQGPDGTGQAGGVPGADAPGQTPGTDRVRGHHHHHGGGSATGVATDSLSADQTQMADALGSLLGTDGQSVVNQLRSGANLNSMLQSANVDPSKLADVLQKGFMVDARA